MDNSQVSTRLPGHIPVVYVRAQTLPEALCKAWLGCFDEGVRVLNVKHLSEDTPLAHDATVVMEVENPGQEPKIFTPGLCDTDLGLEQYRLEVVFGIHDLWVGKGWDYTYHQRISKQIPAMLRRIENTWREKGRITSRDFQVTTWRWRNDTQIDDPPCLQIVHFRFLPTEKENTYCLNMTVVFRSRDLGNACWMNAYAFTSFQRYMTRRIQSRLKKYGITIEVGSYVDISISNHLYGQDEKKRHLIETVEKIRQGNWKKLTMDSSVLYPPGSLVLFRHQIAAQLAYEKMTRGTDNHTFSPSTDQMEALGLDWRNHPYPKIWDID